MCNPWRTLMKRFDRIDATLLSIAVYLKKEAAIMAAEFDALQTEVERNTEVDQSAIVLLQGLAAKIEELKTDPVKLQALADSLRSSSDSLAAAVVANTPAE